MSYWNEENLKKIERIQEEQAKKGVENKETFISRRTKTGVLTGLSAVAAGVAGYGLTTLASTMGFVDPTAITFAIGTGVITILGSIPAFSKLMQNHAKVKELEKIEYRDTHTEQLENIESTVDWFFSGNWIEENIKEIDEDDDIPAWIKAMDKIANI